MFYQTHFGFLTFALPLLFCSKTVDGTAAAEENIIDRVVVFPDAHEVQPETGGCETREEYTLQSLRLQSKNGNIEEEITSRPTRDYARDSSDVFLEESFPLQFPFGIGGLNEVRKVKVAREDCLRHYLKLANPHMMKSDFILTVHSMFEKDRALFKALLCCRSKNDAISTGVKIGQLTEEELDLALRSVQNNERSSPAGFAFLSSLKASCKAMGHTNEAAKEARQKLFSLWNLYGEPSIFFTVSPCDEVNFRIRVYAAPDTCHDLPSIDNMSDEACLADWKLRKDQRTTYPGAGAFDFDMLMQVVVSDIIGMNNPNGGVFGKVQAYSQAVEEQGRKTLHSHFLLWIPDLQAHIRKMLASRDDNTRKPLIAKLKRYVDTIASTKLHARYTVANLHSDCDDPLSKCSNQATRDMRHKVGCKMREGIVASCEKCKRNFNSEQIATDILNKSYDTNFEMDPHSKQMDIKHKLDMIALTHVYEVATVLSPEEREKRLFLINAFYNLHRSIHARSCFKKGDECRFDLPGQEILRTIIEFSEHPQKHFNWFGSMIPTNSFTIHVKRHMLDVFVNQYCPFVSEALGCNSNIAIGNIRRLFYCTTYSSKGTQDEDKKAYEYVSRVLLRRMQRQSNVEDEYSEGISRLFSAVIAHSKANIVSAPLARHLVINGSRFHYSHEFARLPIHAFARYAQGQEVGHILRKHKNEFIPRSIVTDYIHRPLELLRINVWTFVSEYVVQSITKENEGEAMLFQRDHPGFRVIGVFKRECVVVPELPFYFMPDLANVGELTSNQSFTASQKYVRERYAMMALLLFFPFQNQENLKLEDSFMTKYQSVVSSPLLRSFINVGILDNIQRCHNALKETMIEDTLINETVPFETERNTNSQDDNEEVENGTKFDLSALDENGSEIGIVSQAVPLCTTWIQHQGKNYCGLDSFSTPDIAQNESVFLGNHNANTRSTCQSYNTRDRVSTTSLVQLSQRQDKRRVAIENRHTTEIHELPSANGTKSSMMKWGEAFGLDDRQQASFQTLLATFVLTYYDDAYVDNNASSYADGTTSTRRSFNTVKETLIELGGKTQLLMFMTGPGGSGKSRVIDAVTCYARHFCLDLNVVFDDYTIILTALTGVAATNIAGETLHSAVHLETETRNISADDIALWKNTRLLIVDEISFASERILSLLDEKLRILRQMPTKQYGNLNILFAGDFRQLPPVGKDPLYFHNSVLWHGALNAFVELDGTHRFNDDPEWGEILNRFRDGCPTIEDFRKINQRIIKSVEEVPDGTRHACHANKERNAIHHGMFSRHLKKTHSADRSIDPPWHTVVIKGNLKWSETKQPISKSRANDIYAFCGDAHCKNQSQRCDPFLCLHAECDVMITRNIDVKNNKANGTQCKFKGLILKIGAQYRIEQINGLWVRTVSADDVESVVCSVNGATIELKAEERQYKIGVPYCRPDIRIYQNISINQFPIILNTATTGHKLQGQTVDSLLINDWQYGQNWAYVVLSRSTTLNGIFLREELDSSKNFSADLRLLDHLACLRRIILISDVF